MIVAIASVVVAGDQVGKHGERPADVGGRRTITVVAVITRRRRRKRKPPARLDPHPAGSPEAIRIVRAFIAQEQRHRDGDVDAMVRKLERRSGRRRMY